jgi:hypothetical protein
MISCSPALSNVHVRPSRCLKNPTEPFSQRPLINTSPFFTCGVGYELFKFANRTDASGIVYLPLLPVPCGTQYATSWCALTPWSGYLCKCKVYCYLRMSEHGPRAHDVRPRGHPSLQYTPIPACTPSNTTPAAPATLAPRHDPRSIIRHDALVDAPVPGASLACVDGQCEDAPANLNFCKFAQC